VDKYYPKGKVLLGAFQSYSRYAGPREAVFTALCRKNYGCSHFIVGRDHTGVVNFYSPYAVHELFDRLGNIGITPIFYKEMHFCAPCGSYVDECEHKDKQVYRISGTKAREMFLQKRHPPEWFMRKEISQLILKEFVEGRQVFVS